MQASTRKTPDVTVLKLGPATRSDRRSSLWPAALLFLCGLVALLSLPRPAFAAAATATGQATQIVNVERGDHSLLRERSPIGRIAIGNPKIADVALINSHELLVTGKGVGSTSLMVWSRKAQRSNTALPTTYTIQVSLPGATASSFGGLTVQSGAAVSGQTSSLVGHARAAAAAGKGAADLSTVNLDSQVMTQVKIVDVQRNTINKFGLNLIKQSVPGHTFFGTIATPGTLSGVGSGGSAGSTLGTFSSASGFLPLQNAFNLVVGNTNDGGILGVLNVLEQNGLARVLAEPTLTAMSGQTATFLAGGEIPVPVAQSSGGGGGGAAITIQYKEFGIRLSLTPTVLSNREIALKIAPEVSDLDYSNAVSISGTQVPALTVRRTDTTVQLGDGQTFIISGLVSNSLNNTVSKIPWLGDIPIIGAFFRTTAYQRKQRELIMVVTPHLVRPIAAGARVPTLPGASTDNYHPSFADTMFFDTGTESIGLSGYSH